MKKTSQISVPIVDWSYYSKSAVAIAKNESVTEWMNEWHEFNLIPEYNDVSFGFWTLLGSGAGTHSSIEIYQKYVPWFDGDPAKSLVIRPEIEEAIRKQFGLTTPPYKWTKKQVYDINFWLRKNILETKA